MVGGTKYVDSSPPAKSKTFCPGEETAGPQSTWFGQLMGSFTENLATFDFGSALVDIKEIQHHMNMGLDHWHRFVTGVVS